MPFAGSRITPAAERDVASATDQGQCMRNRPHVSSALSQLRGWVTIVASIVCLCGLVQATVFAFANFTSVRHEEIRQVKSSKAPPRVVGAVPQETGPANPTELREKVAAASDAPAASATPDPNLGKSAADALMDRASAVACGIGTLACFGLCVLTLLGVVVAGGANVVGVEKTVTAGVWSVVLAMLCLPWADALPSLRVPGIFASYQVMSAAIDGGGTAMVSGAATYVQWLVMPIGAAFVALGVCVWFRAGVERGVIVTSPSQLDRAIEREAAELAKQGVSTGVTRSVGALNQAIGDIPASGRPSTGAGLEQAIENAAGAANSITKDIAPSLLASGGGRGVADSGYKRLI